MTFKALHIHKHTDMHGYTYTHIFIQVHVQLNRAFAAVLNALIYVCIFSSTAVCMYSDICTYVRLQVCALAEGRTTQSSALWET